MVPRLLIKQRFMNPGLALPIEKYFGKQTSLDSHPKSNVIYLWRQQVDKHEKLCFCCDDHGWRLDIEGGCEQDRVLQQVLFEHMFCQVSLLILCMFSVIVCIHLVPVESQT